MLNQYVNKVQQSNGTVLIDITDTTAVASDVASGKYFYLATGEKVEGTSSGGGTPAISVVDTTDSHGGTVRTITALDISDTTAVAGDVAQGKYFYTAQGVKTAGTGSGGSPSATQHTIYFEFSDSTDTTINAWYDDSFISDAITATEPTTYGQKTVTLAQLDGVTWYEPSQETWETVYDGSITAYDSQATIPSLADYYFSADEVYKVTFSGTEYVCQTEYYQPGNTYIVGNIELLNDASASGLPFLCYNVGWGALYIVIRNGGTGITYTYKLERKVS